MKTIQQEVDTREYLGSVDVEAGKIFLVGGKQSLREVVSFVPGLGNGRYEVYAQSKYVPGFGDRIVKVEMEFISEQELRYLERQYSDLPSWHERT
jgi:hypothetical protein